MIFRGLGSMIVCVVLLGCGPGDGGASESGQESGDGSDSEDGSGSDGSTSVDSAEGSGSATSASSATTPTSTSDTASTTASAECDPFPSEGDACSMPGAYCSSDCSDQCQFCNILECRDGVWSNAEVFPVPCLECEQLCPFSVAAGCSAGAPDQESCVMGCEAIIAGPCNIEWSDARACVGETPTFTCDTEDRPIVTGCEDVFTALYACLGI